MRTKTNPLFYSERVRTLLADEPERLERLLRDPESVDLLTWNVFASLNTHSDHDWLAHRMQTFGGSGVRRPVRLSLWTGGCREPLLPPSAGYLAHIRERARAAGAAPSGLAEFERPVEVPVRVESSDVLVLIDTALRGYPRGRGGRDRLLEVIDAGVEQARRASVTLAVAVVYQSGTPGAAEVSARIHTLRDPATLARELARPGRPPSVLLREVPWQQLLRMWSSEVRYLRLRGEPVKPFRAHVARLGLL